MATHFTHRQETGSPGHAAPLRRICRTRYRFAIERNAPGRVGEKEVLFYMTKLVGGGVQDFDAIKLLKFGTF